MVRDRSNLSVVLNRQQSINREPTSRSRAAYIIYVIHYTFTRAQAWFILLNLTPRRQTHGGIINYYHVIILFVIHTDDKIIQNKHLNLKSLTSRNVFELVKNILFPTASLVIVTLVTNFTARLFEFYFAIMLNLKSINILLKLICSGDKNISQ